VEVQISILTRRRSGSVSARSHSVPCEIVSFGRGVDNEVHLADPRISLTQATLTNSGDAFKFEAQGDSVAEVDGQRSATAMIREGSVIQLGPYEIKVVKPPEGSDLALTVELVRPLADNLSELKARSQTSFDDVWSSRRRFSWLLGLIIFGLFFVWPVAGYLYDSMQGIELPSPMKVVQNRAQVWPIKGDIAWNSGEISAPHGFIAKDCNACHQRAFQKVPDAVCGSCHADIRHHVDIDTYDLPEVAQASCQSCHKEHMGRAQIVRNDQAFCADCHANIKDTANGPLFGNAADFGSGHPEFRPMVVVDASALKRERRPLDHHNWPVEQSNLRFSHKQHLISEGMRVPNRTDRVVLGCDDCHMPNLDGALMQPITMEDNCSSCHKLQFEASQPDRTVPHGDPGVVLRSLREFYAAKGLAGGVPSAAAPDVVRRRPGTPLSEAQRREVDIWAGQQADLAAQYLFNNAVCKTCHVVTETTAGGRSRWLIERPQIAARWLMKGRFSHARHSAVDCASCHAAQDSKASSDVLLPSIAKCQICHAGQRADAKVPSTCVMCHDFHQPHLDRMRPILAKQSEGKP
jgi:predicted CXXCH cytochrome family protein